MRVALVGATQTAHEKANTRQNLSEMVYGVVQKVFADTQADYADLGCTVSASSDFTDGRTISDMAIQDAVQAVHIPESKVSMDGAFAVAQAAMRILSGCHESVLVVAHAKTSEGQSSLLSNAALEPIFSRPIGVDENIACALQAQAARSRYRWTAQDLAEIAARARGMSVAQVLGSRYIANPLHELELANLTDAACGILLTSEKAAHRFTNNPVWLTGFGYAGESHSLGDRDLTDAHGLKSAARRAYAMAGVVDPRRDIDLVEQSAYSADQEALWGEGLGFAEAGQGPRWYLSSNINPSGGGLRSQPGFATGLARVCEVFTQIQSGNARRAVAHGSYGVAGQSHAVLVLEGE